MIEYVHFFYNYILPLMILVSFFIILYFMIFKRMILKEIEQEFLETIHNNRRHSNKNIIEFFDEIETHTKNSLEQLDDDLKEDVKNIYAGFEKIEKEVKEVNRILLLYRGSINEMDDEIKKRDAIIERKTNQLKRIKNEI